MSSEPREAFSRLIEVFDLLEIPYMVGGSMASGVYGSPRMTRDIDIIAEITPDDVAELVARLESEYYIDSVQIRDALDRGRAFNIIHFHSGFKFDIFPLSRDRYQQEQFARRRYETSTLFGGKPIEFAVATAEDVILSKLDWYRKGRQVSEQQWNDVLGIIATQGGRLDTGYLHQWAAHLRVSELLEQALAERHG